MTITKVWRNFLREENRLWHNSGTCWPSTPFPFILAYTFHRGVTAHSRRQFHTTEAVKVETLALDGETGHCSRGNANTTMYVQCRCSIWLAYSASSTWSFSHLSPTSISDLCINLVEMDLMMSSLVELASDRTHAMHPATPSTRPGKAQ